MFFALSQNNKQHLEKITSASYSKLFKELQNGIEILVGQAFLKLWIKTVKMLFNSRTAWHNLTLMLMLKFLDNRTKYMLMKGRRC